MSLKEKIPNEKALKQYIASSWGYFTNEVNAKIGPMQAEFKRVSKRKKIGGAFMMFAIFAIGSIDALGEFDSVSSVFIGAFFLLLIPFVIIAVMVGWRLMKDKNNIITRFNSGINELIFPKVFSILGVQGVHIKKTYDKPVPKPVPDKKVNILFRKIDVPLPRTQQNSPEFRQVMELLDHSELVTENRNTVTLDDMMHITVDDGVLFISELDLKHVTGSGKSRSTKKIFKGYFVSLDLNRTLKGKTFISTEGDEKGFGHRSFWKNMKGVGAMETEFEWNEFEELLHVASTNPSEARYILTTDFMSDLYDWWEPKKQNIRISFVGSRMYMLFPDDKIRFTKTIPSIDTEILQEYVESIAKPLLHVLHLVEDVPRK